MSVAQAMTSVLRIASPGAAPARLGSAGAAPCRLPLRHRPTLPRRFGSALASPAAVNRMRAEGHTVNEWQTWHRPHHHSLAREDYRAGPKHYAPQGIGLRLAGAAAVALLLMPPSGWAMEGYSVRSYSEAADEAAAFSNIPGQLQGGGDDGPKSLSRIMQGKNKEAIQKCAGKCIPTCIRGGNGPGLGPLSMRKEPVVFKEGFRSRSYCISECTQVCALEINGKDVKK